MNLNNAIRRALKVPAPTDLEYLRQGTVTELMTVLFILTWLAAIRAVIQLQGRALLEGWQVALVLILGLAASAWLRSVNFRATRYLLIGVFIAAIGLEVWLYPDSPARYYFAVAVVISSLLVSHGRIFIIAILTSLFYVAIARQQGVTWPDPEHLIYPLLLIYLTALATWLVSRQLHLSLAWMQNSYSQALTTMEQLREQRMIMARTTKALEHAYFQIERMNHALMEARDEAEEARRIKTEFAANISHELRTPLNLIIGFSETMANAPETYGDMVWPPSLRGDVDQVYQSSCHLASLIDDILDLSALDARQLGIVLTETNIGDVIAEAASVIGALYQAKGLYLKVDLPPDLPLVRLDPTRIRQVLLNLLNNASRFTPEGGVTISVQVAGENAQVAVTDTGIGIEPQYINRVFEEFRQVDGSSRRKYGGTGLGIPLSKRLVELHGGRMWLSSTPGEGTTFYFTLPIAAESLSSNRRLKQKIVDPSIHAHVYRKELLVVQPEPLTLHTLRRYLADYDVLQVSAQDDLCSLIEEHQPIALIANGQCDIESIAGPGRAGGLPSDLPVITFSLRDSATLGAQDYLIKPVTRSKLLAVVGALGETVHEVLIVDDDLRVLEMLSRMLQSAGRYKVTTAMGGAEAIDAMHYHRPDAVLLDLVMPDVDGAQVLQSMRVDSALAGIPIIVISAQAYLSDQTTEGGGSLCIMRSEKFSVVEAINCLRSVLDSLPVRLPKHPESVPTYLTTPGG